MKTSRYFANLISSYQAELDDLRTDSEGNNVLKARLAKKREQVPQLLMMMQSAPEMVAVAFHGGFTFSQTSTLESLVTKELNRLPAWASVQRAVVIEPWAESLVRTVLTDPDGESFLVTTLGLEFLQQHGNERRAPSSDDAQGDASTAPGEEQEPEDTDDGHEGRLNSDDLVADEGESTEFDLDKAGADWLAAQGFDRKE